MPYALSDATTDLGYLINDTLSQIGIDQKNQAVKLAWNDKYVTTAVIDTSLSFVPGTYSYPLPSTVTTVSDIRLARSSGTLPEPISADLWSISGRNLIFNANAGYSFGQSYVLYIFGRYKLALTDTIPDTDVGLQSYVVNLAGYKVINQAKYTKALSFLRNDTSLAELMALSNNLLQEVKMYRMQLPTNYVSQ